MIDKLYPAALNQIDISAMKVSFKEYRYLQVRHERTVNIKCA